VLALLSLLAVGAGCSRTREKAGRDPTARSGDVSVFAAASLTEVFTEIGRAFERRHPDVDVVANFNFAASSTLAEQINGGAPADVFAAADAAPMRKVTEAGNARAPVVFARNRLSLLVARGNPEDITGLADLRRPGLTFSMCAPEVPCGTLGAAALAKADVAAAPASLESNVKAVVARVTLGEVDAGIVYATDAAAAADRAQAVPIDIADDPALEAVYEIAVVRASEHRAAAEAWIAFVLSAPGRDVLLRHGFLPSPR
jgi:molybdate transport system substrate-binding protein